LSMLLNLTKVVLVSNVALPLDVHTEQLNVVKLNT
jgi:hypothetical protein